MSVAISNSPVFSPSSSLFCNKSSLILPQSTDSLTLTLTQLKSSVSAPLPSPKTKTPSSVKASNDAVLKRKRPTTLDIPVINFGFCGSPFSSPNNDLSEIVRDESSYSVYCKKGRRAAMEDRCSAVLDLQGDPKQAFFGVFDGHGGYKAAEFAAQNLDKNIIDEIIRRNDEDEIESAVKNGYLNTDAQFVQEDLRGGSCCVTALIRNGNLIVSNAGDCRAVMSVSGVSESLTTDHRPCREDEKTRIESMGGYVDKIHGVWRIQGSLAVSRSIGDRNLKQWVIAVPETKVLRIKPEYEFLILASDGLWDKVDNQEAVDIARPLCIGTDKPDPLSACKRLVDLSIERGSADDISVMMITMKNFI